MLAFLVPFLGIGVRPAISVLMLYALLPILRNTITGIANVPAATINAAKGLGFTRWQTMRLVKIPLALPVIIAGIRTAATMNVGVATLAAFIGAGGLGDFINRGLATNNSYLILLGAIPAALLALIIDLLIGGFEKHWQRLQNTFVVVTVVFALFFAGSWFYQSWQITATPTIKIASKKSTEQYILAELLAQLIENKTKLKVHRVFNLGNSQILQAAILRGDIDIYPEYTGVAYLNTLHYQYKKISSAAMYKRVKQEFAKRYALIWLTPFGFANQQTFVVTKNFAEKYLLQNISDLKSVQEQLVIGAPAEFASRVDGLQLLEKVYHLQLQNIKDMDLALAYTAILNQQVNLIVAGSTDPRIKKLDLKILEYDQQALPPYYAAPVVRAAILEKYPHLKTVIKPVLGLIDNKTMQELNYQIDILHKSPYQVAHNYLQTQGLLHDRVN